MRGKNPTWTIVGIIVVIAIIAGIVIGSSQQMENNEPAKVNVSGKVKTVSPETEPVKIDFIDENSKKRSTASLNENGEYSIRLDSGRYQVELSYTVGGIVSPLPGNCGTHLIDSDNDSFDLRC